MRGNVTFKICQYRDNEGQMMSDFSWGTEHSKSLAAPLRTIPSVSALNSKLKSSTES